MCVWGGGDGDQEEALAGKRIFDMKKIATDDMVGRGANGHKVGLLRNYSEKMMEESVPEHKETKDSKEGEGEEGWYKPFINLFVS